MKIVIVGSREMIMPGTEVISAILAIITTTPPTAEIAVRRPAKIMTTTSAVEDLAYRLAQATGRHAQAYEPLASHGRAAVFERDYTMVDQASKVYAFFSPGGVMYGGTGHVVKAALDRGIEVEAWSVNDDGHLYLVGSEDGRDPYTTAMLEAMYKS